MFPDACQHLWSGLRKPPNKLLRPLNFSVEAAPKSGQAEFELADLIQQFIQQFILRRLDTSRTSSEELRRLLCDVTSLHCRGTAFSVLFQTPLRLHRPQTLGL